MAIQSPQVDRPRGIGGGSGQWDDGPAGVVLLDDYFSAPGAGGISAALAAAEVGADSAAGVAVVFLSSAAAANESGSDSLSGSSSASVLAALVAAEVGPDVASGSASASAAAALSVAESGADVAAGAAVVLVLATASIQETGADVFSGSDASGPPARVALLSVQEAGADSFSAVVSIVVPVRRPYSCAASHALVNGVAVTVSAASSASVAVTAAGFVTGEAYRINACAASRALAASITATVRPIP
jgi:hypothetical protein